MGATGATGTVGAVTNDGVIATTLTAGDLDIQLKLATGSGLMKLAGGLSLRNDCSLGQVLKWDGSAWNCAADNGSTNFWSLTGNTGTNPSTDFLGTTDAQPLVLKTGGTERARISETGNVGIGQNNPQFTLDLTGTFRLGSVPPSVTNADSYLVRDAATGQVSQQTISSRSILKVSANVNAGVAVQLDNIQVRMATSGNRSLEIATVSGTMTISGTSLRQPNNNVG
jgi:hypothetical protein